MLNKSDLPNLKGVHLHDQYKLFKDQGAPNLQRPFTKPSNVAGIREALSNSIEIYLAGTWNPFTTESEEEDNQDEEEGEEEEEQEEGYDGMEEEEGEEEDWEDM